MNQVEEFRVYLEGQIRKYDKYYWKARSPDEPAKRDPVFEDIALNTLTNLKYILEKYNDIFGEGEA